MFFSDNTSVYIALGVVAAVFAVAVLAVVVGFNYFKRRWTSGAASRNGEDLTSV